MVATVKCANDRCDNMEAYFYSVQIRSADEPMTNFYRVSRPYGLTTWWRQSLTCSSETVYEVWQALEGLKAGSSAGDRRQER